MARSSKRARIKRHLDGMLNNTAWIQKHATEIATDLQADHPEWVDWCKGIYDLADNLSARVKEGQELI